MRLVRYSHGSFGDSFIGRLEGDVVVGALQDVDYVGPTPEVWSALFNAAEPITAVRDVQLLAPVKPSKVVCVGLNYVAHAAESGSPIPREPLLFGKWPTSIIGPTDTILLPSTEPHPDFEAELGVVIGREATRLPTREAARAAIGGYTVVNDVTGRQGQIEDGQWARAKGFDTFAPVGPAIVAPDAVDPSAIRLECFLDGTLLQSTSTSDMIFDVFTLVAYISWQCTLLPGDLISTGTPAGIGYARVPRVDLKPGQVLETRATGIGSLINPIAAGEPAADALHNILGGR